MFSTEPRCIYQNNQLGQVICQLRFPEILSISAKAPADFQDAIRAEYPQYMAKQEPAAPKLPGVSGSLQVQSRDTTVNYHFISEDGTWRVNLTSKFISLSTSKYTCWEEFARKLDKPLAAFISIYKPAYFDRVGLRYINFISRKALELNGEAFSELIHSRYLGVLADDELPSQAVMRCNMDAELQIRGGCRAKIHAGPGIVKTPAGSDSEVKFIFDQDLYMPGKVQVQLSAPALQTLHSQAYAIFRAAITDKLHEAMGPEDI